MAKDWKTLSGEEVSSIEKGDELRWAISLTGGRERIYGPDTPAGVGSYIEVVPLQTIRERLADPKLIDALCRATDRNEEWETDVSDHTPDGEELWDRVATVLLAAFPPSKEGES